MRKNTLYIILLNIFILLGLSTGCADHSDTNIGPITIEGDVSVSFNLNFPNIASRAMTSSEEEQIDEIDVLAFVKQGSEYLYTYRRQGVGYSNTSKRFTANLISSSSDQIFVILANAHDELMASGIQNSDNVNSALGKIIFSSDAEWPSAEGASSFRVIPMCGITDPTQITKNMIQFPSSITLMRSLAKVNITLATDVSNFELTSAQVFNRVTKGYVGYKPTEWSNGSAWIPLDASSDPYKTYLPSPSGIYQAEGTGNISNITNKIYILESKGTEKNDYLNSTAIVVGGTYKPDPQTSLTRFYRIDLTPDGLIGNTPSDVVRNYRYDVEIQEVLNEGAPSAQEAFEGVATLKAQVKQWSENTSNVIVDDQYYLKISHTNLVFGKKGNAPTVTVETNYDANPNTGYDPGMSIDQSNLDTEWCTIDIGENIGAGNIYRHEITVNVSDIPAEKVDRYTQFVIKAGNISFQMGIYQGSWEWLASDVAAGYAPGTRNELKLYSGDRKWQVDSVDDPAGILVNPQQLVGLSGGDENQITFYIKTTAQSDKAATLTFTDKDKINPPKEIVIRTAN